MRRFDVAVLPSVSAAQSDDPRIPIARMRWVYAGPKAPSRVANQADDGASSQGNASVT